MKNLLQFIGFTFLVITLAFTNVDKKTIVIDVGHGGHDKGATANEFNEKDIALNIANKIKQLNENSNLEIILTRDNDEFLSPKDRTKKINKLKPNLVISLHTNSSSDINKNGKKIFISDKNIQKEKSGHLAMKLLFSLKDKNVEIKKANFYLLNNIEYPFALIELGYLSNKNDREILTTEKGQNELAEAILSAIK